MPKQAITDDEIRNCFAVMAELRPHLQQADFLKTVRELEGEGFRLAYIENNGEVVAVAGYRIYSNLFMGRNLYVDDLVTAEKHRGSGYGAQLLSWLRSVATGNACKVMHLDSGTQRQRAHKFYLAQGLFITSFHFAEELP
jgi:GNAT superfamily N-acetyltransferase